MRKFIYSLILFVCCTPLIFQSCTSAQKKPFQDEIEAFKRADLDSFPPKGAVLFVGSSSFRLWKDIGAWFPGYRIINRGFGGSGLNDLITYAQEIILPYEPKQVVIYCGENDIATGTVTSTDVLQRFVELFNIIRNHLPNAHIVFVSIKPSPSREKFQSIIEDANIMIRQFLTGYAATTYVDVYHPMLGPDNKPRRELFLEDNLHMNEKGYAIWKEEIGPHLIK